MENRKGVRASAERSVLSHIAIFCWRRRWSSWKSGLFHSSHTDGPGKLVGSNPTEDSHRSCLREKSPAVSNFLPGAVNLEILPPEAEPQLLRLHKHALQDNHESRTFSERALGISRLPTRHIPAPKGQKWMLLYSRLLRHVRAAAPRINRREEWKNRKLVPFCS